MTDASIINDLVQDDGLTDGSNTNQNNRKKHCPTWVIIVCCIIGAAIFILGFVIFKAIRKERIDEGLELFDLDNAETDPDTDLDSIISNNRSMTSTPNSIMYPGDEQTDEYSF